MLHTHKVPGSIPGGNMIFVFFSFSFSLTLASTEVSNPNQACVLFLRSFLFFFLFLNGVLVWRGYFTVCVGGGGGGANWLLIISPLLFIP